ncbi:EcsC family protein [Corynebacterium sp. H127]|uniref:EcsC family protein n=1 Tax=Corynebacterium sp. H127 TaxID=3133418 RepID=UPI0030A69E3F
MSDYEHKAWKQLLEEVNATESSPRRKLIKVPDRAKTKAREVGNLVGTKSQETIQKIPGAERGIEITTEAVASAMQKAMDGLHSVTVDFGMNSIDTNKVIKRLNKNGASIETFEEICSVDLRVCDRSTANSKQLYSLAGLAEGAASSLIVSGLTVSSTVSGGTTAAAAAGAVAADTMTVLAGMGRIVASVGAHYGYDVKEPTEAAFAAGVLSYSTASGSAEKAASLAALSRLTQQMMRRSTWEQLSNNLMVNVLKQVYKMLGMNLTKRKLGQAVPVLGVLINGGMNAKMAQDTFDRAHIAYRLRFLTEKYNLDPEEWASNPVASPADIPLIDEIIEAEIVKED